MTDHPEDYAFPVAPGDVPYWQPGMTLRDWFAGQALIGLCSQPGEHWGSQDIVDAYQIADAMLAEREKGGAA